MRTVTGIVRLPANAPNVKAGQILIEVRDISYADAPSTIVAQEKLDRIPLKPNAEIPFRIQVPEVESNRSLSIRVHVSLDGSGQVKSGDLLTTRSNSVPSTGPLSSFEVPVVVI